MKRIDKIINNLEFQKCIELNKECEKQRIFCKHGMEHLVDTCRLMHIISLEEELYFAKEILYACGLLHDIGKWRQYLEKIPHEIYGAEVAEKILEECDFNDYEIKEITTAIRNHRKKDNELYSLSYVLYKSDKASRKCYICKVKEECKWSKEKKNLKLLY